MASPIQHGAVEGVEDMNERVELLAREDARWALIAEVAGLGATMQAAMDAIDGFVPCGHAFGVVIEGLAASAAPVDAARLAELTEEVRARSEHVAEHRGVPQGAVIDMREHLGIADAVPSMRVHLLAALQGVALAAERAMKLGAMETEVNLALAAGLSALLHAEDDDFVHEQLVRCNTAAARALAIIR